MRNRGRKLYVAHTLTADLGFCHLNSAFVADNALMLYPLIASAVAFPVLRWSKYAFAEQPVLLGLERPIIYCFRLFNLTVRPLNYFSGDARPICIASKLVSSNKAFLSLQQYAFGLFSVKVVIRFIAFYYKIISKFKL